MAATAQGHTMNAQAPGLTLVWTDIPEEVDADFNDWYNREHMRDRVLGVPGFLSGRRFVAFEGKPRYLAIYRTASIDVFRSEPYLALQRVPDDHSRRLIPLFRNTVKGFCRITAERGEGEGARLALVELSLSGCDRPALRRWAAADLLRGMLACHNVVAARLAECDQDVVQTVTTQFMRKGDRFVDAVLLLEAVSEQGLRAALGRLDARAPEACGARVDGQPVLFNQLLGFHAPAAN
jgi:hypothetical protein